ncbi:MAG: alpha-amylase/4-alpha-glucanotransferase domain-containing protein [Pseudomonadota bacterium]
MIDLVMTLHCHQPVGNFDEVFQKAHDQCYRPVLDIFEAHPRFKAGVHFSGPLLEWLEEHRPETLDLLASLVGRGQIEPLSGGFYEPLLASIPRRDVLGQVRMMNDYLEKRLGRRPTGFWLTERIWDTGLPVALSGTGLQYTVVDDTHFYYSGLNEDAIFGPYITEREGHTLKLLATPMVMRYLIPFRFVDQVLAHLRAWDQAGRKVAVYGDDGKKFGLWPGTYEWVIKKGWLETFFQAVLDNSDWLRTTTPGEYVASTAPLGRLYVPQASYEEMTEWALPPDRGRALEDVITTLKREGRWEHWRSFVRGGIWDNFLVKYDEANRMHKKMIRLSERTAESPSARPFVWRAQCNCAYWHGVFGGLYMGHLRRAIHENLIRAQGRLIEATGNQVGLYCLDYDNDDLEEIFIEGPALSLGLCPGRGGGLFELCHMPKALNLSDVLTRRDEAYHRRLPEAVVVPREQGEGATSIHDAVKAKEAGLERFLVYDRYTRVSLLDHFLENEVPAEALFKGEYHEWGDFLDGRYEVNHAAALGGQAAVEMVRTGTVGPASLRLDKSVLASKAPRLSFLYDFECLGHVPLKAVYGCEFNLTLFSDQDESRHLLAPEYGRRREAYETGSEYGLTRFDLINGGDRLKASFTFSDKVSVGFFPLYTVAMSEDGFEKAYQGTTLFFFRPLNLQPGQKEHFRIDLGLIDI